MKIFGTSQVAGKFTATTGSFNKISKIPAASAPGFVVAGTDTGISSTNVENRSLVAQGLFDYVISSQDSGNTINQSKVPQGSVIGYRVVHLGNNLVYSLNLETKQVSHAAPTTKTALNYSIDGGETLESRYGFQDFYGYDMAWPTVLVDKSFKPGDIGYIAGFKLGSGGVSYYPTKFAKNIGRDFSIANCDADPTPAVYITEDGGRSFRQLTLGGSLAASNYTSDSDAITAIAIDPTDQSKVLYGTDKGEIHKSSTAGLITTEVKTRNFSIINRIVYAQGSPNVVYAVSGNNFGRIFRSTDGGDTWQELTLTVNGVAQNYKGGIYDVLAPDENTVLFVGNEYGVIYKSTDQGDNWQKIKTPIVPFNQPLISVKSAANSTFIAALSENNLFCRTGNILPQSATPNQFQVVQTMFIAASSATNKHICFDIAVHPTTLSGQITAHVITQIATDTYELKVLYPASGVIVKVQTLPFSEKPTTIFMRSMAESYIATENGNIYKVELNLTTNELTITEETTSVSEKLVSIHGGLIGAIQSVPSSKQFDNIFACGENGTIIYKDYASSTWTTLSLTSEFFETHNILQIYAKSNTELYVLTNDAGYSYVFKSTDTGASWTDIGGSLFGNYSRFITFDFDSQTVTAVLSDNGSDIKFTIDGGSSWYFGDALGTDVGVADIIYDEYNSSEAANTIKYILVGTQGAVLSSDFQTIYRIGPWDDTPIALVGITGEKGYPYWVGGGTTTNVSVDFSEPFLLRSNDGGDTWLDVSQQVNPNEPRPLGDFIITSLSEGKYIKSSGNDAFYVYRSMDNGVSFTSANSKVFTLNREYTNTTPPDQIQKIHFVNNNVGYAVARVYNNQYMKNVVAGKNQYQIIKTANGGNDWGTLTAPSGYDFLSIFFVDESIGYVTAISDDRQTSKVFKTIDGGSTWTTSLSLPSGPESAPMDVYFIVSNDTVNSGKEGFVVLQGLGGSGDPHGIYRTVDSGANWTLITLADFGASNSGTTHIQFINPGTGFIWGENTTSSGPKIFKTVNTGSTWTAVTAPSVSGYINAGYFFDENTGIVAVSKYAANQAPVIYSTTNGGTSWTLEYTVTPYQGETIQYAHIQELKFSEDETLGIAVGVRLYANESRGDHFILKSTDKGLTWSEIDTTHTQINLQNFSNNNKQNWSGLKTVEFIEPKKLGGGDGNGNGTDSELCFGSRFISASYYNYENFAYKCTKPSESPQFVPNFSQNIGLGKGIFGQLSKIDPSVLKSRLTYGAALGVRSLGKAEYSNRDTAVGYGAMDLLRQAKENVAVGYKALSLNQYTPDVVANSKPVVSKFAISADGIYTTAQSCGVETWEPLFISSSTFNQINTSSLFQYTQVLAVSDNLSYILANDYDSSGSASNTYILTLKDTQKLNVEFTSSTYTVNKIVISNDNILYGLDQTAGYVLKSANGGSGWSTGSIQAFSGKTVNDIKVLNETNGFLVGTTIWKIDTGSKVNWITSSYTGSYELNSIEFIDTNMWISVGESGSIFKTTNNGTTWYRITQSLTTNELNDVKAVVNGNIIAAGISGSIIYSDDRGETWYTGSYTTTESFSNYHYTSIDSSLSGDVTVKSSVGDVIALDGRTRWEKTFKSNPNNDNLLSISVSGYSTLANGDTTLNSVNNTFADLALNENRSVELTISDVKDYTLENVAIGAFSITTHNNAWGMVGVGARTFQRTSALGYNVVNANNNVALLSTNNALDPETNLASTKIYYDFIDDPVATSYRPTNYGQVAIGRYSQGYAELTSFNTSVGYGSLYLSNRSTHNTAIGFYSQHLNDKQRNTSLGVWTLGVNGAVGDLSPDNTIEVSASYSGGSDNVAIGYKSMLYNINSTRAMQIRSAVYSSGITDANYAFLHGSQNISIGSNALTHVSGSSNTVAVGHYAVTNGGDLTDSVFIGSYVGSNFKTPTGSFYSGSSQNLNDWRSTQTVAVGSYAVQNHVGTDIVAVGANALRGIKNPGLAGGNTGNGNPTPANAFSLVLVGIPEGLVLGNYEITPGVTKPWQLAEYPINKGNKHNLLDVSIGGLLFQNNCAFQLETIQILSKSTAYALYLSADQRDADAARYPILVKSDRLDKVTDVNQTMLWDTVQHVDGNGVPSRTIKGELGKASSGDLNVIDENNLFILSSGEIDGVYKSIDGGISFTTALNAKTEFGDYTKLRGMHFTSENNGFVVGTSREEFAGPPQTNYYPFYAMTDDGGATWTYDLIDGTSSGKDVNIYKVWADSSNGIAYAVGAYGSIYKTADSGSTWSKLAGKSFSTSYVNSTYDSIPNNNKLNLLITDVFFADASTGWVTATSAGVAASTSYVLKTTDGGTSWTLSAPFTNVCYGMRGYGVPILTEIKAVYDPSLSNYRVFVSAGYGILYTSVDGGATFSWNRRLPATIDPNNFNVLTDCVEYAVTTFDVYTEIDDNNQNTERTSNLASVSQSVAVGADIQVKQDFVENNVAVGYKVQYNASGSAIDSVQIGAKATIEAHFVKDTVAIGKDTLFVTKHSDKTTAVGRNTLRNLLQDASRPQYPVLVINANYRKTGGEPEVGYTDSTINTVIGYQAGSSLIMGDSNVFVGSNAGMFGNPNIPTYGNNNIMIGANAAKTAYNVINEIGIGNYQHTAAWLWGQYQNAANPWGVMSDGRDKTDTGSFSVGLNFIRNLQPKEFKWDGRFNYASGSTPNGTYKQSGSSYGYIAQDVELAADAAGISGSLFVWNASGSYSGSNDPSGSGNYPLKMLMPGIIDLIAINAIKELDTLVSYISGSKYATNLGNSSDSTFSVTHSLGTRDVIAMVYSNLTEQVVYPTMSIDTINHVQVVFPTPPGTDEYRIVIKR